MKKQTKLIVMLIILGVAMILCSLTISHYLKTKSFEFYQKKVQDLYQKDLNELKSDGITNIRISSTMFNKYCIKDKEIIQPSHNIHKKYVLYNCSYESYSTLYTNSVILASTEKEFKKFNNTKYNDTYGEIKELPTNIKNVFPNQQQLRAN